MAVFPFDEFVTHVVTNYDVQADSVLALYIKIATYLRDNPIVGESTVAGIINKYLEENPIEGDFYSQRNPPPYPVTSVNGKTGDVTGLYDQNNQPPYPVTSVNGKTGVVTGLYDQNNQPPYPVTSVNGKTGDVTGLYDQNNQPPYPVTSVNGKTGAVTGLYDQNNQPPYPVTSVNGSTGAVKIETVYSYDGTMYLEAQTTDGLIRNCASWSTVNGKRYRWIFYADPNNLGTFHSSLFDEESNEWKDSTIYTTFNPPPETVKISRITTEVYGEGSRHRFLKSALPGLNSSLTAQEAILSVVNASSVPMVSSRFEYDGNYVTIALNLLDSSAVTNSQTLTIFYR